MIIKYTLIFLAGILVGFLLNKTSVIEYAFNGDNSLLQASLAEEADYVPPPYIKAILSDLRLCESGGKDNAINKVDLDGTSSWGRYQFKPETLYYFATRYKILEDVEPKEIYNVLMDGELQERVLIQMIEEYGHERSFWLRQFPGCSKIYKFWEYI